MSSIWLNDTVMIPIISNSVTCDTVTCQTMTCQTMDITNLDFTTITGNECDFNNVNCGNLGATGPSNLNSITGTSLTINNDTVLNNLRLQTLNVNNSFNHAVVHDPTTTQLFYKDDYVDKDSVQTLTNKTLTAPVISSVISSGNVVTFPTVTADLIGRATTDIVSNKSFYDEFNDIIQFSDESIKIKFRCGGMTNTTTRIVGNQASNIEVVLPSTAGTLALVSQIPSPASFVDLASTQTITGSKTFDSFTLGNGIINSGGKLYLIPGIPGLDDTIVTNDSTSTLSNKTLNSPVRISGLPIINSSDVLARNPGNNEIVVKSDIVTLAGVELLQNKTLSSPVISQIQTGTGVLTLPTGTTATLATTNDLIGFVTQTGTATLTNKTINTNGPNSILVNNVLITNLLNQDVRTTASPIFVNPVANSLSLNNSIGNKKYEKRVWSVTTNDNVAVEVLSIPTNNNTAATITTTCTFYVSLGANVNKAGSRILTNRGLNVTGTVTISAAVQNLTQNDAGLNGVTVTHISNSPAVSVRFTGLIGDTIFASGTTEIFYN